MDRSDIEETLVSLYLRLNGYFVSGFIVHAENRVKTELDVLAVRFPRHLEPEREVRCCKRLAIPSNHIDFIVGEVKGTKGAVNFNARFRENSGAVQTVLRRFGAFEEAEILRVMDAVPGLLDPANLRRATRIPGLLVTLLGEAGPANLRFVPFAAGHTRRPDERRPYVFGSDLLEFAWECFRPEQRRAQCDDHYNYELWGPQFTQMVQYFKNPKRGTPGTIRDLYHEYGV